MSLSTKELTALELMAANSSLGEEKKLFRGQFYGDPGAGKTTLAANIAMELGEKALFLTTDSAWSVLYKYPDFKSRIHRIPFAGFSQVDAIVDAHELGIDIYGQCETLIWDTVDSGVDIYLRALVESKKNNPNIAKQQADPAVEGWPHYRIAGRALLDTVTKLEQSSLHIIYVSHVREPNEQDAAKKKFAIRPAMPESCFKVIHKHVQMLGFMYREKKGSDRMIQLEGTLQETAKSQISTIPEATYKANEIPGLIKKWREA